MSLLSWLVEQAKAGRCGPSAAEGRHALGPAILVPGRVGNAGRVACVDAACFAVHDRLPLGQIEAILARSEQPLGVVRRQYSRLAMVGGRIVGFALARANVGTLEIDRLAVLPQHRRQGIGLQLMADLLELADVAALLPATIVRESNLDGLVFFREAGFRAPPKQALIREAFADGETGVAMILHAAAAQVLPGVRIAE